MTSPMPSVLVTGSAAPLPTPLHLFAGPLAVTYVDGDLRSISLAGRCIVQRVFVGVRATNWDTILPDITAFHLEQPTPDSFTLRYRADHRYEDIHFINDVTITGTSDGVLTFSMHGVMNTPCEHNRTGLCVLHPMTLAGHPFAIEHIDGSRTEGTFPAAITPGYVVMNMRAISHEVLPGIHAEVRLTGETFEMEDQRNWSDSTYKIYGRPRDLPVPIAVDVGEEYQQTMTLRLIGEISGEISGAINGATSTGDIVLTADAPAAPLPRRGTRSASHARRLTPREADLLRGAAFEYMRVDLPMSAPRQTLAERIAQAREESALLALPLEIGLHLSDRLADELTLLGELLTPPPQITRWLLFAQDDGALLDQALDAAPAVLHAIAPAAPIGIGTAGNLINLNSMTLANAARAAVIAYAVQPQVHGYDLALMLENLPTQAVQVAHVQEKYGRAVAVGPVTLRGHGDRFLLPLPDAATDAPPPMHIDPRQMALVGAGWTLASLGYLCHAESVTYYETTGPLGLMETEDGSLYPADFPSLPGGVYPLYHVLADAGTFAAEQAQPLHAEGAAGLILRRGGTLRILLANLTADPITVRLPEISQPLHMRLLDADRALFAMQQPDAFRAEAGEALPPDARDAGGLRLTLPPFAYARLDSSEG